MENQYYESYELNQIVKVSKIVKNHIFFTIVPIDFVCKIHKDIPLICFSEYDEIYYRICFNKIEYGLDKKLTIRQFSKTYEPLDLSKVNKDFINDDDNIYYKNKISNKLLDEDIIFKSQKEADLFSLVYKLDSVLRWKEGSSIEYNIKIWDDFIIQYIEGIKELNKDNNVSVIQICGTIRDKKLCSDKFDFSKILQKIFT